MKHKIIITFICLLTAFTMNGQDKLIYVGDPMCSWCYGFAPQLDKLVEQYNGKLEIELVTGGLRAYNQTPIHEMKDFLKEHWEDVNKATQQPFRYEILDNTKVIYDTEPACRAMVVIRNMNPKKEFEFFKRSQQAFYFHNKDLGVADSYYTVLEQLGLDKIDFTKRFNSEEYKNLVKEDFRRAGELGVQGFPSLLFESGGKITVLSRGYTTAENVIELISAAMEQN